VIGIINQLKSINKEALDEIAVALNNGSLSEEEAKIIDLNPFEYTVAKAGFNKGKQSYTIRDRNHNMIKKSVNKEVLDEIAVALNNGEITEEEVKSVIGVNKVLEMLKLN
jgi:ATP:corrinoid adenosyltransferase